MNTVHNAPLEALPFTLVDAHCQGNDPSTNAACQIMARIIIAISPNIENYYHNYSQLGNTAHRSSELYLDILCKIRKGIKTQTKCYSFLIIIFFIIIGSHNYNQFNIRDHYHYRSYRTTLPFLMRNSIIVVNFKKKKLVLYVNKSLQLL